MKPREVRIDKKHRFPLRISEVVHCEADAICFSHNLSLNLFYSEAIKFAMSNDGFINYIRNRYIRDTRRGHFVYHKDNETLSRGRIM